MKDIVLDNGKYTIVFADPGDYPLKCLRYGNEWRSLVGDNLIHFLCCEIVALKDEIAKLKEKE